MARLLVIALVTVACKPEQVLITPTRIERVSCATRWAPCLVSEDTDRDGVEDPDETWTGMCTAVDECTTCTGRCATLAFQSQPTGATIGDALSTVTVEVRDPAGATMLNVVGDVTIDLDAPPPQVSAFGTLLAPLEFGQAVFNDVRISAVAVDLRLRATWAQAEPAVSDPFSTTPGCAPGTIAYWPLDETSGASFADLVDDWDGGCSTCPTFNDSESAWQFDSAGDGIDVPGGVDAPFQWGVGDDLAVELWLRADPTACTTGTEVIVGRDVGDPQQWWIGCRDSNRRVTSWWSDVDANAAGVNGPVLDDLWHHVVFQRQVSTPRLQLIVDGELVGVSSTSLGAFFDQPVADALNIGWLDRDAGYHYSGHVAHVALYRRTLLRGEIMAHRNLGRAATYCDVVPPRCGDGQLDAGEACDDGNAIVNDGCSPLCRRESRSCPADLLTYWRLDGVGLDRFDDEISGLHLDCSFRDDTRTGPDCPEATAGIIDGGQEFDGTSTALEVGAPNVAAFDWGPDDSFSVEAWIRTASGSTCAGNQVVVGRRQETPSWAYFWLGCVESDGSAHAELRDADGSATTSLTGPVVTDNAWHHLALTVDAVADTVSLYVDGAHAETIGIPFAVGFGLADNPLEIGSFAQGYHFEGTVDAVAIYSRALHLAEIMSHWASGAGADICSR